MSYVQIGNKVITASVESILQQLRKESNNRYFKDIVSKGNQLCITCPSHKEGNESHPSCYIIDDTSSDMNGVWHCFTCGLSGNFIDLVAYCFNNDIITASEWLSERFADTYVVTAAVLPEINFEKEQKKYLDESILDEYSYFHPYMFKRGLTEEIIRKFKIGCTPDGKYITFPFWDGHGHLIGIFKRSTVGKEFIIPRDIDKGVYLLNYIIKEHITKVCVCEGLFDALVMWTYGYPSVALCGAGTSKYQMQLLNTSGIRDFILMYDNDFAGRHGAERFKNLVRTDVFVTDVIMPKGKDCASCTKEEIDGLVKGIFYG